MKKMIKKYRNAKGFTLVELLIVIIIIGILAGMMMLSTGSATDKAEATRIVSDMRNVKSAVLMFFADEDVWLVSADNLAAQSIATDIGDSGRSIADYLDSQPAGYFVGKSNGLVYVEYQGAAGGGKLVANNGVAEKLTGMVTTAGLYNDVPTSADTPNYNGEANVFMIVKK